MQLPTKFARVAAGAAIVGAAGLTTAVAVAQGGSGPTGSQYGEYGYGYGDYGGQVGAANGHRLHCPSYEGMYHSKGHAQCHYAPRGHAYGVFGTEDNTSSTTSQSDVQGTNPSRHDSQVRSDDDAVNGSTSTTEADDQNEDKATSSTTEDQRKASDGARQDGGHRHRGSGSNPYESND